MLLMLLDGAGDHPDVNPLRLHRLTDLGVTDLAILRGEAMTAVLLQGWAFEPAISSAQASEIVAGTSTGRLLLPVLQASISHPAPAAVPPPASTSALAHQQAQTERSRT